VKDIFNIAPILLLPLGGWRNLVGVSLLNKMKIFFIKSPTGKVYTLNAESKFHAIQKAIMKDDFKYTSKQYK
jgi:hypothetical protein